MNLHRMKSLTGQLLHDEQGFIISMELILIATILVIGLIVGMSCLQSAIVQEFTDLSWAVSSLNQNYQTNGYRGCKGAYSAGSAFWGNNWYRGYPGAVQGYGYGYGYGGGYGDVVGYSSYNVAGPGRVIVNQYPQAGTTDPCLPSNSATAPNANGSAPVLINPGPCDGCAPAVVPPTPAPKGDVRPPAAVPQKPHAAPRPPMPEKHRPAPVPAPKQGPSALPSPPAFPAR